MQTSREVKPEIWKRPTSPTMDDLTFYPIVISGLLSNDQGLCSKILFKNGFALSVVVSKVSVQKNYMVSERYPIVFGLAVLDGRCLRYVPVEKSDIMAPHLPFGKLCLEFPFAATSAEAANRFLGEVHTLPDMVEFPLETFLRPAQKRILI